MATILLIIVVPVLLIGAAGTTLAAAMAAPDSVVLWVGSWSFSCRSRSSALSAALLHAGWIEAGSATPWWGRPGPQQRPIEPMPAAISSRSVS